MNAKRACLSGLVIRARCSARIASVPAHAAQRQFLRHLDEIGFGKRQPGYLLFAPPHALGDTRSPRAWSTVRRNAPKYADFSEVDDALRDPCAQRLLAVAGRPMRVRHRIDTARRHPGCARGFARRSVASDSAGNVRTARSNSCRRRCLPLEHVVPQRDPRDAARQAVADIAEMIQKELPASIVEHEETVSGAVAVGEHVVR